MITNRDPYGWVDKLPEVLRRWHELTDYEQEAIGRLVNRIASQPMESHAEGIGVRFYEWQSTCTAGIEVRRDR
jgi:hypothetical protein